MVYKTHPAPRPGLDVGPSLRSLDVVVVAYRSARLIDDCLDSIASDLSSTDPSLDSWSVVVVDNASPDDSASRARAHEGVRVVASDTNRGFGGGCNLGASAGEGEGLFFVNPDARLSPGCTSRLLRALEADASLVAVGPALVDPAGLYRAVSGGFEPSLRSIVGHYLLVARLPFMGRFFAPMQLPAGTAERRPDWTTGGALLVRRAGFEAVGGFDESIFLYMEDVDLCRRLRAGGGRIGYVPEAVVLHELGGTQGSDQPVRWIDSFYLYLARSHGPIYVATAMALVAVGLGLRAVVYMHSRTPLARRLGFAALEALRCVFSRPAPVDGR